MWKYIWQPFLIFFFYNYFPMQERIYIQYERSGGFAGITTKIEFVSDDELRNDLMSQARYFLPHLLVLSTSSPFWEGQNTGLRSSLSGKILGTMKREIPFVLSGAPGSLASTR